MKNAMLLAVCALMACGPAVTGTWKGPPIGTLRGQLDVKPGLRLEHPVGLAVAWYPNLSGDTPRPPGAIVIEEVEYQGVFPQAFTFNLYGAPPPAAREQVVHEDGSTGEAAVGQLLAYEDLDGDGTLTVDASGRTSDRILGSTAGAGPFDFFRSDQRNVLAWVRRADDLGLEGMSPGFNLLRFEFTPLRPPQVLSLNAFIALELTGDPRLGLITCPEAYADPTPDMACGTKVWSTPEVSGSITLRDDGGLDAFVSVPEGAQRVAINGTNLETSDGLIFTRSEATPTVLHTGVNWITVEPLQTAEDLLLSATVPARFDVLEPTAGARLAPGAKLRIAWTPSTGATIYAPSLSVGAGSDGTLTDTRAAELTVPMETGPGEVTVTAFDRLPFSRAAINGLSVRTVAVDVQP